jgi:vacuolar-type H+-ATPase subunit E/Vma4
MNKELEKLVAYLLHSQTQTHVFHLQTKSYAEHKALQKYYEGIDDLVDGLVESYQGKYDIITQYDNFAIEKYSNKSQLETYFKALSKKIEEVHKQVEDTYIQNQLDTVVELINSTLYKIRFLA